jgi:hypothetical protein
MVPRNKKERVNLLSLNVLIMCQEMNYYSHDCSNLEYNLEIGATYSIVKTTHVARYQYQILKILQYKKNIKFAVLCFPQWVKVSYLAISLNDYAMK